MSLVKDIVVKPIKGDDARRFIRTHLYSGKTTANSQLHLGVFMGKRAVGCLQFGPSLDKTKLVGLVRDTPWYGFMELNRMAMINDTPRNSESRAIAMSMRLIRQQYPQIQWIVSFADATQCGDGTIYRASGFILTGIKKNTQMIRFPDGRIVARKTLDNPNHVGSGGRFGSAIAREQGAVALPGFQLRYVYFLDPTARARLTVPEIPFSRIAEVGASMYLGKPSRRSRLESETPAAQAGHEGAAMRPTGSTTDEPVWAVA